MRFSLTCSRPAVSTRTTLFDFLDDLFRRAHGDVGRDQDLFELVVKFLAQLIFGKQQAQLGGDAFARLFQGVFDLSE